MISIIGAGPAGSTSAYHLAKKGYDVTVYEEHKEIGHPIQCTGIVSNKFKEIISPSDEFIINKINTARIHSPNNNHVEIKLKENYILDRAKFDSHLAQKGMEAGAKYKLSSKFSGLHKNNGFSRIKINSDYFNTEYLIGADGPLSEVAKYSGLYKSRKFFTGIQIRAKVDNDNTVDFYPYVGNFSWAVPEDENTLRIGVASYSNTNIIFKDFIKRFDIKKKLEIQAGLIPIYDPNNKAQKDNVILVGDAACQVKATTGGGIIQAMQAADCAADAIATKKPYDALWKKSIGKELLFHHKARNIMDKFGENDWNTLIEYCSQEKIKKLLSEKERDNLVSLSAKMAIAEPRLLGFLKHLF
ncbi:MAG: NAD(P)/FAD-dependent oxidoreductase [archaeon]